MLLIYSTQPPYVYNQHNHHQQRLLVTIKHRLTDWLIFSLALAGDSATSPALKTDKTASSDLKLVAPNCLQDLHNLQIPSLGPIVVQVPSYPEEYS